MVMKSVCHRKNARRSGAKKEEEITVWHRASTPPKKSGWYLVRTSECSVPIVINYDAEMKGWNVAYGNRQHEMNIEWWMEIPPLEENHVE